MMAQRPATSCSVRPRSPATAAVWFLPAAALLLVLLLRWPSMGSYAPVSPRNQPSHLFALSSYTYSPPGRENLAPFLLLLLPQASQAPCRHGAQSSTRRWRGTSTSAARRSSGAARRRSRSRCRTSSTAQRMAASCPGSRFGLSPPPPTPVLCCSQRLAGMFLVVGSAARLKFCCWLLLAWQAADPPVRANVLYLDPGFANVIS